MPDTPSLLFLASPLLLACGALALLLRARKRWHFHTAGRLLFYLWFLAALPLKTGAFYGLTTLEPAAMVSWVDIASAAALLLLVQFLPSRLRSLVLFTVAAAVAIWVLGATAYFRYYAEVVSLNSLRMAGQVPSVSASLRALLELREGLLLLDLLPAAAAATLMARSPARNEEDQDSQERNGLLLLQSRWATSAALVALALPGAGVLAKGLDEATSQRFQNRIVVERVGLLAFYGLEMAEMARDLMPRTIDAQRREEIESWFERRRPLRQPDPNLFGLARGRNLLLLQVESLQSFCLDLEIEGKALMPNLRRLRDRSAAANLDLGFVIDQSHQGRTSDTELMVMTGLLPVSQSAASFRYSSNRFVSVGNLLAEKGYSTISAVPFSANFWNRRTTHANYGFQQSLFDRDFEQALEIGWGLNDRDFLIQMAERLEAAGSPFFAFLVTLSLHHPYESFPDQERRFFESLEGNATSELSDSAINYLEAMHFFDRALGGFIENLKASGLWDETVVVIFGDHDAGLDPTPALSRLVRGRKYVNPRAWKKLDSMPLVLHLPDDLIEQLGSSSLQAESAPPAALVDLPTTILPLMGIDPSGYAFMGRNLLSRPDPDAPSAAAIWIDDRSVLAADRFLINSGAYAKAEKCFDEQANEQIAIERCDDLVALSSETMAVARDVLHFDLQQELSAQN